MLHPLLQSLVVMKKCEENDFRNLAAESSKEKKEGQKQARPLMDRELSDEELQYVDEIMVNLNEQLEDLFGNEVLEFKLRELP